MQKKQTIFYIDGFNLYHGLLKDTPSRQWLDLERFATSLLPRLEEHDVVSIKYFTARIKYNPADPQAAFNQDRYLDVLETFPKIKIIEGSTNDFGLSFLLPQSHARAAIRCTTASYTARSRNVLM